MHQTLDSHTPNLGHFPLHYIFCFSTLFLSLLKHKVMLVFLLITGLSCQNSENCCLYWVPLLAVFMLGWWIESGCCKWPANHHLYYCLAFIPVISIAHWKCFQHAIICHHQMPPLTETATCQDNEPVGEGTVFVMSSQAHRLTSSICLKFSLHIFLVFQREDLRCLL